MLNLFSHKVFAGLTRLSFHRIPGLSGSNNPTIKTLHFLPLMVLANACGTSEQASRIEPSEPAAREAETSLNPISDTWYADPEGIVFGEEYWIFPTYSDRFERQVYFDAFSSKDLLTWEKHERILDSSAVSWAHKAMWAPSAVEKDGKYYFFFGANDIQTPEEVGGIGVAVADSPGGPYEDYLGEPLVDGFHNGAQPIDQFVYKDVDGTYYMFYGGWGHCNLARLNDDFTGFIPWDDGETFHEITPEGYVEGPFMFERGGTYYFMWSEGNWGDDSYSVAYATAGAPTGPYERIGTILGSDKAVATGAGHHSVMQCRTRIAT